ncbi:MAG: hypothetical protein FWC25_00505 [Dehalococcoidia bacterium]|nr:hypothetical protein [Dehalococcoidia bacterium]
MDLSSLMGGGTSGQEQKTEIVYKAQVTSPIVNGEVKLSVGNNALTAAALFDVAEIPFAMINSLTLSNYVVIIETDIGVFSFSRMGSWCQPFYDALIDAYNKAVLRSMFVKSSPIFTAIAGDYYYTENDISGNGEGAIHVYDNSVVVLPPNLSARRVPLCFVCDMSKGDYKLTLKLDTGESYTYAKLGYDTDMFGGVVKKQIFELREKSLAAVKDIDLSLTMMQASKIATLMPQGVAATFGHLTAIAPSFAMALESKLADTRAAESYKIFKKWCDPAQIYVGFRKNESIAGDAMDGNNILPAPVGGANGVNTDGDGDTADATNATLPTYLLWLVSPSSDGQFAIVEFAESDTATFVYRTDGNFNAFVKQINKALEAINFKREAIYLSDEELRKPENADYYMGAKRTAALQFVRSRFAGRVIHSSVESWKRKLMSLCGMA